MSHFHLSVLLRASTARIYGSWLNSSELGAFMGGLAFVDPQPGGRFYARSGQVDGYIFDLKPSRQIVQTWRTPDLPRRYADSLVALIIEPFRAGYSRLTVEHVQIPENLAAGYERAWREDYLEQMRRFFAESDALHPQGPWMPAFQTV